MPLSTNVSCPFCGERVPCSVKLHILGATGQRSAEGAPVVMVDAELDPDVIEQFKPHLRSAHPREYAQLESPAATT